MIRVRIAIYSRKSKWTGRGDSVENQVAMCREYADRCIRESKNAEILVYEDEGFSGKNTKRPEFQRMMNEIHVKKFDYLICYRLDRLGRNMIDLATLIEELNRREISFISVKEQFDTSTPMGKAMLYFAGILAQMEREQIAERVRDNMLMLARSGRWLGGNTPLGFFSTEEKIMQMDGKTRKTWYLRENEPEIDLVRLIFRLYLEYQSLVRVAEYLQIHNICTRRKNEYTVTAVRDILRNPVYCAADREGYEYFRRLGCQICWEELDKKSADRPRGLICYAKTTSGHRENPPEKWILAPGKHRGIISGEDFVKVQKLLENNKRKGDSYRIRNEIALLSGILFCSCGQAMRPKYYAAKQTGSDGKRRFSYICPRKNLTHGHNCCVSNLQGNTVDEQISDLVRIRLTEITDWQEILKDTYSRLEKNVGSIPLTAESDILNRRIKEKHRQISNLLYTLSSSSHAPEFIRQVETEILELQSQIKQMEEQKFRDKMEIKSDEKISEIQQPFSLQLTSLESVYSHFNVHQKRELIRAVLDKIIWDGKRIAIILKK